jgi:hypothetical protein
VAFQKDIKRVNDVCMQFIQLLRKSQAPNNKLQINLKLQYPMTKTDELATWIMP